MWDAAWDATSDAADTTAGTPSLARFTLARVDLTMLHSILQRHVVVPRSPLLLEVNQLTHLTSAPRQADGTSSHLARHAPNARFAKTPRGKRVQSGQRSQQPVAMYIYTC